MLKTDLWEEALEPGGLVFDFATKNGKELYRTLKPKGVIILILDNATNPMLSLLFALLRALRKYPTFYVERTYSLWKAKQLLRCAGFRIEDSTAIVHAAPLLPITINELCRRGNSRILLGICRRVIRLSDIVGKSNVFLKYLTGYYVVVKATKR